MIRFVDVSYSLGEDGYRFAYWDTIVNTFYEYGNTMAWETWADFVSDFYSEEWEDPEYANAKLERFKGLYPGDKK